MTDYTIIGQRALRRANALDAIESLKSYVSCTDADGDATRLSHMTAALESLGAAIRNESCPMSYRDPAWYASHMASDAGSILRSLAEGNTERARAFAARLG